MAIGSVQLKLGIDQKGLVRDLQRVQNRIKRSVNNMKNIFLAAKLGSYLFSGVNKAIEEFQAKARAVANFKDLDFDNSIATQIFEISNNFEKLGYSAETANDAMLNFVSSGKATALRQIGVYLDKNTASILSNNTAQERMNWLISNAGDKYKMLKSSMLPHISAIIETRKNVEDLQKSLGQVFLTTLNNFINAFGGIQNAMKIALIAFTAYKTATIIGNVAIGISKTLAMGGIFAAPLAFGMGAAALAGLLAMGAGTGIALSAISASGDSSSEANATPAPPQAVNVSIQEDIYGRETSASSGNTNTRLQSNYGGND